MTGAKHSINAFMHSKALEGVAGLAKEKEIKMERPEIRAVKKEMKAEKEIIPSKRKQPSKSQLKDPLSKARKVMLRPEFNLTTAEDDLDIILKFLGITSEELLQTNFPMLSRSRRRG